AIGGLWTNCAKLVDATCTVDDGQGRCLKGHCAYGLGGDLSQPPEVDCHADSPMAGACKPECNETCENGECRGFKLISASPAPPLRLVSNETQQCADSVFVNHGCDGCILDHSMILIEFCGSPRNPKVCLGDPATRNWCHFPDASISPMIWDDVSC